MKVVGVADQTGCLITEARYTVWLPTRVFREYDLCKQKALNRVFLYAGRDKEADLGCNQREALFHNIFCCVFI